MSRQYLHNCSLHCDHNEEVLLNGITYFPPPLPLSLPLTAHILAARRVCLSTAQDRSILTHLYNLKVPVHVSQSLHSLSHLLSLPFCFFKPITSQSPHHCLSESIYMLVSHYFLTHSMRFQSASSPLLHPTHFFPPPFI